MRRSGARCSWKMMVRAALRASTAMAAGPVLSGDAMRGMTVSGVGDGWVSLSRHCHVYMDGRCGRAGGGGGMQDIWNSHH